MYKRSKFIWSSGHSDENKARWKFNQWNILPTKNSQSTVSASLLSLIINATDDSKRSVPVEFERGGVFSDTVVILYIVEIMHNLWLILCTVHLLILASTIIDTITFAIIWYSIVYIGIINKVCCCLVKGVLSN